MKPKLKKQELSRLVSFNFQAALIHATKENAISLQDHYKMKQKQMINNAINIMDKQLNRARLTEEENNHLEGVIDAVHDVLYEMKKDYRKQLEQVFEIVD